MKKLRIALLFALILLITGGAFAIAYLSPDITVAVGRPVNSSEFSSSDNGVNYPPVTVGFSGRKVLPFISKSFPVPDYTMEAVGAVMYDNGALRQEVLECSAPTDITAEVTTDGSRLKIIYSGKTTKNGVTEEYYKEYEYDFGGLVRPRVNE